MSIRQNLSQTPASLTQTAANAQSSAHTTHYYTIGDRAREFGVTLRSLRFYEDRGLLNPLREGLLRLYDGRDRTRLQVILKGKALGFTLTEIREMVGDAAGTQDISELKLSQAQIDDQIEHLERQQAEILRALAELRAQHPS